MDESLEFSNQRERERLTCIRSALDAESAAIARDRSALHVAQSKLRQDQAEFRVARDALNPRFREADDVEHRANIREKAVLKAEDDARNAAAEIRLIKVDVDKREAAANEAKLAATVVTQRAEQLAEQLASASARLKLNRKFKKTCFEN